MFKGKTAMICGLGNWLHVTRNAKNMGFRIMEISVHTTAKSWISVHPLLSCPQLYLRIPDGQGAKEGHTNVYSDCDPKS